MREICTSGSDRGAARRLPSLPDLKRIRTADCVVVGVAGEESAPMLVLALRHTDGELRHCGLTRPVPRVLSEPIAQLLKRAGPARAPDSLTLAQAGDCPLAARTGRSGM
jgi:hypothetical protein